MDASRENSYETTLSQLVSNFFYWLFEMMSFETEQRADKDKCTAN